MKGRFSPFFLIEYLARTLKNHTLLLARCQLIPLIVIHSKEVHIMSQPAIRNTGHGHHQLMVRCLLIFLSCIIGPAVCAQHDGARDSVQQIAVGQYDKVDKILENKKPFAGDAESAFVKMLESLAKDQIKEAENYGNKALELGLPAERLLVGPRELTERIPKDSTLRRLAEGRIVSKLVHGPMIGSVTDKSASVWLRTLGNAEVVVRCVETGERITARTHQEDDWTAVLTLNGLLPEQEYHYIVEVDGKEGATSSFRTYHRKGESGVFKVGFGGGAGYVPEWERMWDTVLEREPHAFFMMGDNVYIDQPEQSLTQHYCYYRRQSRTEWRRFTSKTAIYSIWDDHDFGTNDCVPGPEIEQPAWKRPVWQLFKQNWVNPAYGGGPAQPGCWFDFHVGDVHFIMLDGRYYRDLKGGSMLGPVQKQWLLETLEKSSATFKVIASPVPFTIGIKKGSRDPWDGFPEEREAIFDWIKTQKIEGVFLIAADRHRTDLRITERSGAYDLYEFESSKLTNHHTHPVVKTPGLVWGYNQTCSFGLMTFDTTHQDPQVMFECVDLEGTTQYKHVLKLSELKFD